MRVKCPQCQTPVPWKRLFITNETWACHGCQARLKWGAFRQIALWVLVTVVLIYYAAMLPITILYGLLPAFVTLIFTLLGPFYNKLMVVQYGPEHCPKCGYCLTGLISCRCPECGTEIEKKSDHDEEG